MLLATIIFYVVMLAAGPVSFVESLPDLDLGGGITMTDTGQIQVKNPLPTGPPRIPAESEYEGITTP